MADGRYLAREGADEEQSVLVVETLAAPPLTGRRRRRSQPAEAGEGPPGVPLARATAVRAHAPFVSTEEAERWLLASAESEQAVDDLVSAGLALVNRALFAQGAAVADPHFREMTAADANAVRIGYGTGEEVAIGRYTSARYVDVRATGASRRRQRSEELQPQERVAAVLGGRETVDACEALLLRARADLDADRDREAALQLRVAIEALLVELDAAIVDPGHEQDMVELRGRRAEIGQAAHSAIQGELGEEQSELVRSSVETCERILRRRRVLRGG